MREVGEGDFLIGVFNIFFVVSFGFIYITFSIVKLYSCLDKVEFSGNFDFLGFCGVSFGDFKFRFK